MSKIKTIFPATLAFILLASAANAQIPVTSNFDPAKSLIDNSAPEINVVDLDKKTLEIMKQNYEGGYWSVFQGKSGAPKGQFCTAMFVRQGDAVSILGPGGDLNYALLNFSKLLDSKIPVPNAPTKIKVSFQQGNDAPVEVTLANLSMELPSGEKTGVISMPVPTIQALMDGMEDNYRFVIKYKGETLSDIEWNKGFIAREELKKCLAGNTNPFTTMLK